VKLRVTSDTTVALDALNDTRPAAGEVFAAARRGEIDLAFSTRLERELVSFTLADVRKLLGEDPVILGTSARWELSTWDGGDVWVDVGTVSTEARMGRYRMIDSDHLEAHRLAGRDVFLTSDRRLRNAARDLGFDALTPEELLERVRART
jgi:hypothetical protein